MSSFINRITRHLLLVLVAGSVLLCASRGVHAGSNCTGGGGTFNVPLPSSVAVPRDVSDGTLITPWQYSGDSTWSCDATTGYNFGAFATASVTGALWGGAVTTPLPGSGLSSYKVIATNIPGVGIAIAADSKANVSVAPGCAVVDWRDVLAPGVPQGAGWPCGATSGTISGSQTLRVAVALVKIGPITTPGTIPAQEVAKGKAWQSTYPGNGSPVQLPAAIASYRIPSVYVTEVTCTVADVDVPLGTHRTSEFTGVGSTVGTTDFVINVQGCPAGMKTVRYRLELAAGVPAFNAASGIVKLDATSTATGVAVQVTDRNDVPYNFSTMPWANVTPTYAPASGGNYTIPLRAAYYQTAATVTTGPANSAVMFTMEYK